jgi:DNA processing protein
MDTNTRSVYNSGVIMSQSARLLALVELLSPHLNGPTAAQVARQLAAAGIDGTLQGLAAPEVDASWLQVGVERVTAARIAFWAAELDRLTAKGVSLVTVADDAYPHNLRLVTDQPPLLFVQGTLTNADERSMAVVGTRHPSANGLHAAARLARDLANRGVTVVSGLAQGVDTAAHTAALDAGGRTLAVMGTGIQSVFPAANRALARRIQENGACLSQFWPSQGGTRWTFPVRNVVTSGLSVGTVVVEAGETSGARLQAQDALRHGKRLFLLSRLVTQQPWAAKMATLPGVTVVTRVDEVIDAIEFDMSLPQLDLVL